MESPVRAWREPHPNSAVRLLARPLRIPSIMAESKRRDMDQPQVSDDLRSSERNADDNSRERNQNPNLDRDRVAQKAYDRYLSRGGAHGDDVDDWLQAEQELTKNEKPGSDS